jgi:hypothetical protein
MGSASGLKLTDPSSAHAKVAPDVVEEKRKFADVELVNPEVEPELIVVSGGVVSTVHEKLVVAELPAASVVRTVKLWLPSTRLL